MKSPLMPIAPKAIRAMFSELAAEQPGLVLPTRIRWVRSRVPPTPDPRLGLHIARDVGFRMPTVWLAEGHSAVAPVHLYRFDWATPVFRILRLGASHAAELPYVWGRSRGRPP